MLTHLEAKEVRLVRSAGVGERSTSGTVPVVADTARKVLALLHRYQRIGEVSESRNGEKISDEPCVACFETRAERLAYYIDRGEQIHFVVPAFPAKSPNPKKVIGKLPDLGEQLALAFLQTLCDYVGHFYAPGARITICSDGHVLGDVVGVADISVTAYRTSLWRMIRGANLTSLDLFGLDDAFGGTDYPKLRQTLEHNYASPVEELKASVRSDPGTRLLFNGIHRFMFEDALARGRGETSRTRLRNESKESAYQTIVRSNAWSRVVAERFPRAIRLSIHPQPPHSEKFGLRLMRSGDNWLTPWHGVVLDDGANVFLIRRWEAEELKASLILRRGSPSHFVGPHIIFTS